MARKQAQRRRQKKTRRITLPKLRLARLLTPLIAAVVVVATYHLSIRLLDREISSLVISGPMQRVSALMIEEAVSAQLDTGFVGADLDRMRATIQALTWIDQAAVARRWPDRIAITVSEQVPAAIWGDSGLLNVRGELFVDDARHIPAELPRLSGPDEHATEVAKRYLDIRDRLIPIGLDVRAVDLDARGAWRITLANGIEVRLGRRDVDARTDLFVDIVANVITGRAADISYVDMRYSNGFTVGWKDGAKSPVTDPQQAEREMLASRGAQ